MPMFLHRLSSLQQLCSNSSDELPQALLFIPGQDGRNNGGATAILLYLFFESTGKELFDGTIDIESDALDEIVLLVEELSVSVFWTRDAKRKIGDQLLQYSFVKEYMPSEDEENDVDAFQSRKCLDFKVMIVDAVRPGKIVGMPIPLGYDDVNDVENWPLLRAFAMDSVGWPTGFLTTRNTIVDISELLDILFRVVDECCVAKCVDTVQRVVLPHILQMTSLLDADTAEQRALVTADEAIGPLAVMFEFGELDCVRPPASSLKPVLLFTRDSNLIGGRTMPNNWENIEAGKALHCIVEASEPTTGLRWCRSYFLGVGKALAAKSNVLEHRTLASSPSSGSSRLQALYVKLSLALRCAVRFVFPRHRDALEAAKELNSLIDACVLGKRIDDNSGLLGAFLSGSEFAALQDLYINSDIDTDWDMPATAGATAALAGPAGLMRTGGSRGRRYHLPRDSDLRHPESLRVHIDCCNALGEIISMRDVDDMGGGCWIYVRLSLHDIRTEEGGAAVAVGDTFLFSPNSFSNDCSNHGPLYPYPTLATALTSSPNKAKIAPSLSPPADDSISVPLLLRGDCFCATHCVPLTCLLRGVGEEENSALRLLSITRGSRGPHVLSALGFGRPIDGINSDLVHIPMISDHPLSWRFTGHVRLFTDSFVVEKSPGNALPLVISLEKHVECCWTLDAVDCLKLALATFPQAQAPSALNLSTPEGLMVIFRLRPSSHFKTESQGQYSASDFYGSNVASGLTRRTRSKVEERNNDNSDDGGSEDGEYESKQNGIDSTDAEKDLEDIYRASWLCNPLDRGLPDWTLGTKSVGSTRKAIDQTVGNATSYRIIEPRHIALFIPSTDSRTKTQLSIARREWYQCLTANGIPCVKGSGSSGSASINTRTSEWSISPSILASYLAAVDAWSYEPPANRGSKKSNSDAVDVGYNSNYNTVSVISDADGLSCGVTDSTRFLTAAEIAALSTCANAVPRSDPNPAEMGLPLLSSLAIGNGYLPLRAVHSVSETLRLQSSMSINSGDDDESPADARVGNSAGEKEENKEDGQASVVLVVGQAGSGVVSIASQISFRIAPHLRKFRIELQIVDLSILDETTCGGEEALERAIRESFSSSGASLRSSVVVVAVVIISAVFRIPFTALVSLIGHHRVRFVISVTNGPSLFPMTSKIMMNKKNDDPAKIVGLEGWKATCFELSQDGLCDEIIFIDDAVASNTHAVSSFRAWLVSSRSSEVFEGTSSSSSSAAIEGDEEEEGNSFVRLAPTQLRLDQELIERIIKRVRSVGMSAGKRAKYILKYGLSYMLSTIRVLPIKHSLPPSPHYVSMKAVHLYPPRNAFLWSLSNLAIALRALFPSATCMLSPFDDYWMAPAVVGTVSGPGMRPLQRAIFLAKVKVVTKHFRKEAPKAVEAYIMNNLHRSSLSILADRIVSVHGFLCIDLPSAECDAVSMTSTEVRGMMTGKVPASTSLALSKTLKSGAARLWVNVEATAGAIYIRAVDDAVTIDGLERAATTSTTVSSSTLSSGEEKRQPRQIQQGRDKIEEKGIVTVVPNRLVAQGFLTEGDAAQLSTLLSHCGQFRLTRKRLLDSSDFTAVGDLLRIQTLMMMGAGDSGRYHDIVSPSGWAFDGTQYVDMFGTRSLLRPDIQSLVDEYVEMKNKDVKKYNMLIAEVEPFIHF